MNVTAMIIGFMFPWVSRNSVSYKFELCDSIKMGIEYRFGKSAAKGEFPPDPYTTKLPPEQLRFTVQKGKGPVTRVDIRFENGVPKFDGISGQLLSFELHKTDYGYASLSIQAVLETKNLIQNPLKKWGLTIGINFKFDILGGIGFTARTPRFNFRTLSFE
jgi:hypothetical protein